MKFSSPTYETSVLFLRYEPRNQKVSVLLWTHPPCQLPEQLLPVIPSIIIYYPVSPAVIRVQVREECTIASSHKVNVTSSTLRRCIFKISFSLIRMGVFRTAVTCLAFQFDSGRNIVVSNKKAQSNELCRGFAFKKHVYVT